jgi:2-amino-4-hydroxy-6-hydroxymethyldihydropteridine diphosphokinase
MVESLIALGTNLGDREENLRRAVRAIGALGRVSCTSSVFETEPMYLERQGPFLNCVICLETDLAPRALLDALRAIEAEMGRERGVRYGPRTIDLDILFYGGEVVSEEGLEIPHPRIAERRFVLAPLSEVRPRLVHPVLGKTVSELASSLVSERKVVRVPVRLSDLVS